MASWVWDACGHNQLINIFKTQTTTTQTLWHSVQSNGLGNLQDYAEYHRSSIIWGTAQ